MPWLSVSIHRTLQFWPRHDGNRTDADVTPKWRTNAAVKIFAVVRLDLRRKWWRNVRKAWKVDLGTSTISPVPTKGIRCLNEGFGV